MAAVYLMVITERESYKDRDVSRNIMFEVSFRKIDRFVVKRKVAPFHSLSLLPSILQLYCNGFAQGIYRQSLYTHGDYATIDEAVFSPCRAESRRERCYASLR
jgi:hypothetical protein